MHASARPFSRGGHERSSLNFYIAAFRHLGGARAQESPEKIARVVPTGSELKVNAFNWQ